jgi:hypothetical protein
MGLQFFEGCFGTPRLARCAKTRSGDLPPQLLRYGRDSMTSLNVARLL